LRNLFNDMITASSTYVIPSQELARLTLISPSNEAAIRRRSTISANRSAALGEINGMPVLGPLGPPQPTMESEVKAPTISETEKLQRSTTSDVDSEATLVSDGTKVDITVPHSDDKGTEVSHTDSMVADAQRESIRETSEQSSSSKTASADQGAPPGQPPPVPPRPETQPDPQKHLIEEVEIGAQQDVTEVINNVLFQSQCAIKPISLAPDSEQLDQVKE
jgi:ubiquitin carboxyl-terminal hydrolase 25/28